MTNTNGSKEWKVLLDEIKRGNLEAIQWFKSFLSGSLNGYASDMVNFEHQNSNFVFLINSKGALIFDAVGLGKTYSALLTSFYLAFDKNYRNILITGPPKLVQNKWVNELCRLFPTVTNNRSKFSHAYKVQVIKSLDDRFSPSNDVINFVFVSINLLARHLRLSENNKKNMDGKNKPTRESPNQNIIDLLNFKWDIFIADEVHNYSRKAQSNLQLNIDNQRTSYSSKTNTFKVLEHLTKQSEFSLLLTATPQGNSPLELFSLLGLIDNYFNNLARAAMTPFGNISFYEIIKISEIQALLTILQKIYSDIVDSSSTALSQKEYLDIQNFIKDFRGKFPSRINKNDQYHEFKLFFARLLDLNMISKSNQLILNQIVKIFERLRYYTFDQYNYNKVSFKIEELKDRVFAALDVKSNIQRITTRTLRKDVKEVKVLEYKVHPIAIFGKNSQNLGETRVITNIRNEMEKIRKQVEEETEKKYRAFKSYRISRLQKRLSSELYSFWKSYKKYSGNTSSKKESYGSDDDWEVDDKESNDFDSQAFDLLTNTKTIDTELITLEELHKINPDIDENTSTLESFPYNSKKYEYLEKHVEMYFQNDTFKLPLLIFTEFIDTQNYIADRLDKLLKSDKIDLKPYYSNEVFRYSGKSNAKDKNYFLNMPNIAEKDLWSMNPIIISTDAGSQGFDIPFVQEIINYDIPWNPVKLIQRIGRVDRINRIPILEKIAEDLENRSFIENASDLVKKWEQICVYNFINGTENSYDFEIYEKVKSKVESIYQHVGVVNHSISSELEKDYEIGKYNEEDEKQIHGVDIHGVGIGIKHHIGNLDKTSNHEISPPSIMVVPGEVTLVLENTPYKHERKLGKYQYLIFPSVLPRNNNLPPTDISKIISNVLYFDSILIEFKDYSQILSMKWLPQGTQTPLERWDNFNKKLSSKFNIKTDDIELIKIATLLQYLQTLLLTKKNVIIFVRNDILRRKVDELLKNMIKYHEGQITILKLKNFWNINLDSSYYYVFMNFPTIQDDLLDVFFYKISSLDCVWMLSWFEMLVFHHRMSFSADPKVREHCIDLKEILEKQTGKKQISLDIDFSDLHDDKEDGLLLTHRYSSQFSGEKIELTTNFGEYTIHEKSRIIRSLGNDYEEILGKDVKIGDELVLINNEKQTPLFETIIDLFYAKGSNDISILEDFWDKFIAKSANYDISQLNSKFKEYNVRREVNTTSKWVQGQVRFPDKPEKVVDAANQILELGYDNTEVNNIIRAMKELKKVHQQIGKIIRKLIRNSFTTTVNQIASINDIPINPVEIQSLIKVVKVLTINI